MLDRDAAERNAERERRYQDRYDAATDELAAAEREYRDALAAANTAAEQARMETGDGPDGVQSKLDELAETLRAGMETAVNVTQQTVTQGTFNPAAILSLQGSNATEERIADATAETARNTRRLIEAAGGNTAL
jgi:hypothetical protein